MYGVGHNVGTCQVEALDHDVLQIRLPCCAEVQPHRRSDSQGACSQVTQGYSMGYPVQAASVARAMEEFLIPHIYKWTGKNCTMNMQRYVFLRTRGKEFHYLYCYLGRCLKERF